MLNPSWDASQHQKIEKKLSMNVMMCAVGDFD
jgi:hypothetical protein